MAVGPLSSAKRIDPGILLLLPLKRERRTQKERRKGYCNTALYRLSKHARRAFSLTVTSPRTLSFFLRCVVLAAAHLFLWLSAKANTDTDLRTASLARSSRGLSMYEAWKYWYGADGEQPPSDRPSYRLLQTYYYPQRRQTCLRTLMSSAV